jgi:hypothetical protein
MMYRQGTIVAFDPVTLENTVLVGGSTFSNLPVWGVGESTLLVPGATVALMVVGGGGAKTMAIIGRTVVPNTADAADAVSLLSSQVFAATVAVQQTRTTADTSFGDLATVGPEVTVSVRASGRLLVVLTSQIQWIAGPAASPAAGGWVSLEMAGANTMTAATAADKILPAYNITPSVATSIAVAAQVSATAAAVFDGLTPGETLLTMKYARQIAAQAVDFGRRTIVVITL